MFLCRASYNVTSPIGDDYRNLSRMYLLLVTLASASIFLRLASGTCVHVPNDDMLEYECEGGSPADLLGVPPNAGKIAIARMSMPRVSPSYFSRFGSNLWVLSCSHCDIGEIDDGAFGDLTNLQQLSLDNNRLRVVKGSWFKGLEYLTFLDLNYNEIERIEDGVFENARYLVDLRVSGNRLQCLNVDAMAKMEELQRMYIADNPNFKCPNAVTRFMEARKITLEKDAYWDGIRVDQVSGGQGDWRATTSGYRERIFATTGYPETTRQPYYNTRRPYYPTSTEYWTSTESDVASFDRFTERYQVCGGNLQLWLDFRHFKKVTLSLLLIFVLDERVRCIGIFCYSRGGENCRQFFSCGIMNNS